MFNKRVKYAIMIYLFILSVLYIIKPSLFFNLDNSIKGFGIKSNETLFTIYHVAFIIALLAFILL